MITNVKPLRRGEKLVLRTMNFSLAQYMDDPTQEGGLFVRTPRQVVKAEMAREDEEKRQANLARYIARGWAFTAPTGEGDEDDDE